jgi:hypothetical protein
VTTTWLSFCIIILCSVCFRAEQEVSPQLKLSTLTPGHRNVKDISGRRRRPALASSQHTPTRAPPPPPPPNPKYAVHGESIAIQMGNSLSLSLGILNVSTG